MQTGHRSGIAGGFSAGDIDNDGDQDIYTTVWRGGTRLYLNNGDGTFANVSELSGAGIPEHGGIGPWQSLIHDFDGDGRQDIFVAVDFDADRLLMQQSDGTFQDVAPAAGVDRAWNGMGAALGDVDNDGDFDLYVTNISDLFPDGPRHSTFYLDESTPGAQLYSDASIEAGVDDVGWGWGVTFMDVDNDGWLDLAATNGFFTADDSSRVLLNNRTDPVTFADISARVGMDDNDWGSGLAAADFDRDGDLDLLQTCANGPLRLMENRLRSGDPQDHHYLVVRPRHLRGPSRPLGAVVEVETIEATRKRLITAGTSFMTQEPAEAFFGLGSAATVDRVTVYWPGGEETTLHNVAADQYLTVHRRDVR